MRDRLNRLFWRIFLLLASPIIWSFLSAAFQTVTSNLRFSELGMLSLGLVSYLIPFLGIRYTDGKLYHNLLFWMVFRHELTHALTAFSLGSYLNEMYVLNPRSAASGVAGFVSHYRVRGPIALIVTPFIALAPYYLPIFTIPLLLLKILPSHSFDGLVTVLIGFSLGFHIVSVIDDLQDDQSDIRRIGHTVAITLILFLNTFFLVLIYSATSRDIEMFGNYLVNAWSASVEPYKTILKAIGWL